MKKFYENKIVNSTAFATKLVLLLLLSCGFQLSAQNTCATAQTITAGTYTVSAVNGTYNSTTSCSSENATFAEWYKYTPTVNHSLTITSDLPANICKDTFFAVFTGTCGSLTCHTSDDDSGIIACNSGNTNSYLSKKTFDVFAGTTYYIMWDNRWSSAGFDFQLIEAPYVPSPCLVATPITAGTHTVTTLNGGNITTTCSTATLAKWFSYTPTASYNVTITSDLPVNICKDTNFSVYTGTCVGGLSCVANDDNSGIIACNVGNTNSNLSTKTFEVAAGVTYYIAWDNRWSTAGFDFQLTEQIIVQPVSYIAQNIATVNSSFNLCVVDMNGDHKDDIVGVDANNLKIHYQNTGGPFTVANFPIAGTSNMPWWSIAAGDYNKDGYNDLLLGDDNGLTFWKSNNTGSAYTSITPGQYIFCQRTNFVDLNNDGNLDAFSCHDVDPNVYYLNDGSGNFSYFQSGTGGAYMLGITPTGGNYASLWTDFDNDGDSDLFISKCSGPPCELHRNDGNGVFTDISAVAQVNMTPIQSWSSAIFDYDNDGDMDILIGSNGSVGHKFLKNNLNTTNTSEEAFTNITAGSGWDTNSNINRDYIAYDFDNNGYVDVMGGGSKIMFNQGNGIFVPTTYTGMDLGAVGDLNNDGFLDFLNGGTVRYAVPNGNNWFKVSMQGVASNSNGIGARVKIQGPWGIQIRDIRSGEGFEFMSTLNAHFGLGASTVIDQLTITWPSGTVDVILNPAANQMLFVAEGSSPALGVNPNAQAQFGLFPNPAKEFLNVKFDDASIQIANAEIYDLNGRLLSSSAVLDQKISVQKLAVGTYILILKDQDGKRYSHKFIKN